MPFLEGAVGPWYTTARERKRGYSHNGNDIRNQIDTILFRPTTDEHPASVLRDTHSFLGLTLICRSFRLPRRIYLDLRRNRLRLDVIGIRIW